MVRIEQSQDNPAYVNVWSRGQHFDTLADDDKAHLIAQALDNGRPVGYVILSRRPGTNHSVELVRITIAEKGRGSAGMLCDSSKP